MPSSRNGVVTLTSPGASRSRAVIRSINQDSISAAGTCRGARASAGASASSFSASSVRRLPGREDFQLAVQILFAAGGPPRLAAGGLRDRAGLDQDDRMDFQFVPDGNRRADRLDRRVGVQVAVPRLDFLDDHQLVVVLDLDRERGAVAHPQSLVGGIDRLLDVFRIVVPPANDDQVLQPAGHEKLLLEEEPQVAGPQERAFAATRKYQVPRPGGPERSPRSLRGFS